GYCYHRCMATKSGAARAKVRPRRGVAKATLAARAVFVIMPFTATPSRTDADLREFFNTNIKARIESDATLAFRYSVMRSDDTFNITERIIHDLYDAHVVICDLSGHTANPNVMYELGVRLAITNKPVILIREASPENRRIFDIQGFYAHEYSPTRYRELEDHLIQKLRKFESGEEVYESPVLKVLHHNPSLVAKVKSERTAGILRMVVEGVTGTDAMVELVVDRFLAAEANVESASGTNTVAVLLREMPRLSMLEWSRLVVQPRLFPALQTFLSEPLLSGLLPDDEEKRIGEAISKYYNMYFAVESAWARSKFDVVTGFFLESFRVSVMLDFVADSLVQDDEGMRKAARANAMELA